MRIGCGIRDADIFKPDFRIGLNAAQLAFMQYVDGRRTIRELAACVAQGEVSPQGSAAELEQFGGELFQSLWRLDFVAMALDANSHR
jgi:hypothetical protein